MWPILEPPPPQLLCTVSIQKQPHSYICDSSINITAPHSYRDRRWLILQYMLHAFYIKKIKMQSSWKQIFDFVLTFGCPCMCTDRIWPIWTLTCWQTYSDMSRVHRSGSKLCCGHTSSQRTSYHLQMNTDLVSKNMQYKYIS